MARRIKIFRAHTGGVNPHRKLEKRVNRFLTSKKKKKGSAAKRHICKKKITFLCDGDYLVAFVSYKERWI